MNDKKTAAIIAAWVWVGQYEAAPTLADDFETYGYSVTLEDAFEHMGTPARVKARFPEFPEDMVDAFALLRRSVEARKRARREA
ncbi:hypothetical protein GMYAFLOJ_CDS0062 [Microbacterium phage phiMiGM15]